MHLVLFEDHRWGDLAPLSLTRPTFALLSGGSALAQKIIRNIKPSSVSFWVRPEMEVLCGSLAKSWGIAAEKLSINRSLGDAPALLVAANTLLLAPFHQPDESAVDLDDDQNIRAAYVRSPGLSFADAIDRTERWKTLSSLRRMPPQGRIARYLWDLLAWNEASLADDFTHHASQTSVLPTGPWHLMHPENISIDASATLSPGVVLDAGKGAIVVAAGASVGANSVVQGPAFIGQNSHVQPLSLVRPGVSIGPGCKVAGEISASIIQGNTNKAHHGYLGDSYVGEWVNLAAGTSTSNLKTTYGQISMNFGSRKIDTGRQFLGSLIGDHTKTAIDTRLMTGTYIGPWSMIASSALTPTHIPSFSFLTDRGIEPYKIEKAMEVLKQVYSRRNRKVSVEDEAMMRYVMSKSEQNPTV